VTIANQKTERRDRVTIETALKEAMTIDGAVGVSLVDWDSGMSLGALGGGHVAPDHRRVKSVRVYPSALTVGWMKLYRMI
jgi:hypothetical protein